MYISADRKFESEVKIMRELTKEYMYDGKLYCIKSSTIRMLVKRKVEDKKLNKEKATQQTVIDDIADKTDSSPSTVTHWLKGHHMPDDFSKVIDMIEFLDADIEQFMLNEEMDKNIKDDKIMEVEQVMKNLDVVNKIEANIDMRYGKRDVDYSDELSVVRDIYFDIIDFIEEFRDTIAFYYEDKAIEIVRLGYYEEIDSICEASKKVNDIRIKLQKAMLSIPYNIYEELGKFIYGFLENCLGNDYEYIWDIRETSENEYAEARIDNADRNVYDIRFEKYVDYCEKNKQEDTLDVRIKYVNMIAETAYEILEEIFAEYIRK